LIQLADPCRGSCRIIGKSRSLDLRSQTAARRSVRGEAEEGMPCIVATTKETNMAFFSIQLLTRTVKQREAARFDRTEQKRG
jgi:hypothetical protein